MHPMTVGSRLFIASALFFIALPSFAASIVVGKGTWPKTWPSELEPLRDTSTTISFAAGTQEEIYEIPFQSREQFESLWPVILTLKTPGAPVRMSALAPKREGALRSNDRPVVRIYAPSGGILVPGTFDEKERKSRYEQWPKATPSERKSMVDNGHVMRAEPPWPAYLISEKGELPEYVTLSDGPMNSSAPWCGDIYKQSRWLSATVNTPDAGFLFRARVEIELDVDGDIIDLNRIALPADTPIVDHRSTAQTTNQPAVESENHPNDLKQRN